MSGIDTSKGRCIVSAWLTVLKKKKKHSFPKWSYPSIQSPVICEISTCNVSSPTFSAVNISNFSPSSAMR